MTKWHRHTVLGPHALAVVCFSLASLAPCGLRTARSAEESAWAPAKEGSLLVATREAADSDERSAEGSTEQSDDDSLEPVAESSDRTPDLATTVDDDGRAPQIGANLTKFGRSQQAEVTRGSPVGRGSHDPARGGTVRRPATTAKKMRRGHTVQNNSSPVEPVRFQGIMVGESTKQELIDAWGEPIESADTAEGSVLAYDIDPFQAVEVLIGRDEIVEAIKVALAAPLEPENLAEQLSLNEFRPVTAKDDADQPLGQAFPERGVLFMFPWSNADALAADGETKPVVSHVVLQQIDPLAFAMRAENAPSGAYAEKIADLKTAVELNHDCAHAHWLLASIYLATGQADEADAAAREACQLDPDNAKYQLCRARTQELLGEYDNAVVTVRGLLDRDDLEPIDKAQALHQMGRLASLGDVEIASKAITFQTRAIEVADTLATSTNSKERRAAKHLLVEAHMAVAEEVARQSFNQKTQNLSLWIGRASGLAEDFIANDGGSVELRMIIAQHALASLASFRPTLDPAPWVKEAEDAAKALSEQSDDELWRARIEWELGLAYLHALRVEHVRRETQTALEYGEKAVDNLAAGAASRQAVHSSEQMVGQLYFQMGAVHAVHQLDHVKAAQWYDKAKPLLTGTRPASELYAPRREGEMLVSMGVTFWQLGEQDHALQLTQNGVNLVESAVEQGILAKTALAIPYGNLATMYQKIGENTAAAKYAKLAKTVAPAAAASSEDPPRVGQRTQTARQNPNANRRSAQRPKNAMR